MVQYRTYQEIDAEIKSRPKSDIVSRECKHITYSVGDTGEHDMLTVKEWIKYKDGTRLPKVTLFRDYKRPIWITKEPYRDHEEKIQFEDLKRVDKVMTRQIDMSSEIYNRIRYGNPSWPVRRLARKPYIYGGDFGSEVYLKQAYMDKYPGTFEPNNVTVIDAETDVSKPGQNPLLWSLVNDDEIILFYNAEWTKEHPNYEDEVRAEYEKTLPQYMDFVRKKLTVHGKYPEWIDVLEKLPMRFVRGEDHVDITLKMVNYLHLTQPDLVTAWNAHFDASVIHGALIDGGYDPRDVLSDPRVPKDFRMAYLKEGPSSRKTASGVEMRLAPFERWHVMLHTASWRLVDSMQLYWQLRKAKGKEVGGYGLDAILTRQIGIGKVRLNTDDSGIPEGTFQWHVEMQKKFKVSYGVYALFDSIGLKCLEFKNNDLTSQLSALAGSIDYSQYNSQPKINSVDMHFFALKEKGKVLCTTSDDMETEADNSILARDGWIVTFPSHLVRDIGLHLFEDMPTVQSTIYMFGADADVETTYPTAEIILNSGKEQTEAEACYINAIGAENQRRQSINVTGGRVNAIEVMQVVNGMVSLDDWADHIAKEYYS